MPPPPHMIGQVLSQAERHRGRARVVLIVLIVLVVDAAPATTGWRKAR